MNKVDTKELIFSVDNRKVKYEVEIAKRDKDNEEIHLRVLEKVEKLEVSSFLKVEVKMTQGNEIYNFFSIVLNYTDNIIIIKEPEKVSKVQRRKNKRYNYKSDVEVIQSGCTVFGESFNLSKGGLGFRSKEFFFRDQILFINLRCPIQRKIYRLEVVVKDQFVEEDGIIRYGVEFAEWVRNEFDYLLKFLEYREQNKKIRKEKKERAKNIIKETVFEKEGQRKSIFNKLNLFRTES